jgi:hypothetical protein
MNFDGRESYWKMREESESGWSPHSKIKTSDLGVIPLNKKMSLWCFYTSISLDVVTYFVTLHKHAKEKEEIRK